MVKRIFFGWNVIHSSKYDKDFKLVTLGKPSEAWHGMEINNKSVPLDLVVPQVKYGTWVGVEFGERDTIEEIIELKDKNG